MLIISMPLWARVPWVISTTGSLGQSSARSTMAFKVSPAWCSLISSAREEDTKAHTRTTLAMILLIEVSWGSWDERGLIELAAGLYRGFPGQLSNCSDQRRDTRRLFMGPFVGNHWSAPKAFLTACIGGSALHRVAEYTGDKDRLLLVMLVTEEPGFVGSVARVCQL